MVHNGKATKKNKRLCSNKDHRGNHLDINIFIIMPNNAPDKSNSRVIISL